MEAPASANRKVALPGRESGPGRPELLWDTKVERMATLPPREEGELDGLE